MEVPHTGPFWHSIKHRVHVTLILCAHWQAVFGSVQSDIRVRREQTAFFVICVCIQKPGMKKNEKK